MNQAKNTTDILMEAFDNNETGIMLWDPDDVLVYINKATQDFINSLGASITIGIKFEDFANNLLQIKRYSLFQRVYSSIQYRHYLSKNH